MGTAPLLLLRFTAPNARYNARTKYTHVLYTLVLYILFIMCIVPGRRVRVCFGHCVRQLLEKKFPSCVPIVGEMRPQSRYNNQAVVISSGFFFHSFFNPARVIIVVIVVSPSIFYIYMYFFFTHFSGTRYIVGTRTTATVL